MLKWYSKSLNVRILVIITTYIYQQMFSCQQEIYKLDPAWFYTNPRKAQEAELELKNICLDLIIDPNIYLYVEDGILGGLATINHRHAKSNTYMLKWYSKSLNARILLIITIYIYQQMFSCEQEIYKLDPTRFYTNPRKA